MHRDVPYIKYFVENYTADPSFREQMRTRPLETLQERGIPLDAELALEACDILLGHTRELRVPEEQNRYPREYREYQREAMEEYGARVADDAYADRGICLWSRQVHKRCRMESRQIRRHGAVYYYPLVFELSDGCSVQCPFCGVDAPRFKGNFSYTPENAGLWREILKASVRYLGRIGGAGACYMATEPFDNPDYEKFVYDFRSITGLVPQTTTAIAEQDPERIRAYMKELGPDAMRRAALRFSVRSLRQLEKIQEVYRLDELKNIELLPSNPESMTKYSLSGRAVRLCEHMGQESREKFIRYGISCTAGLRVNMVRKTMEFMEPELPSPEYPNGYSIRETLTFADAGEFEAGMKRLFGTWARAELPEDRPLYFNAVCRIAEKDDVVEFWGDGVGCSLAKDEDFLRAVRLVREAPVTFEELCRTLLAQDRRALLLWQKFQYLYERGYVRWT